MTACGSAGIVHESGHAPARASMNPQFAARFAKASVLQSAARVRRSFLFFTVSAGLLIFTIAAASRGPEPSLSSRLLSDQKNDSAKPTKGRFRWNPHPSLHWPNGTHIDFRLRLQEDVTGTNSDDTDTERSALDFARRRVGVTGEIAHALEFQIERELASDDGWRDVYADYRQSGVIRARAGHFKLPFSLDENTSPADLDFAYRSLAASLLAPGRDWGVMAHGRVANRRMRYEFGLFDHDGRNARTRNVDRVYGGRTLAGRLLLEPFRVSKGALHDLSIGAAFTASALAEGLSGLRGRTVLDDPFFPANIWVRGPRRRVGLEAQWLTGPFSVKAEHIRVATDRRGQSVEDRDLSPLIATGWYLSGTWALTGERKAGGLDTPARPLFRGGWGTVELAARRETVRFFSAATGQDPSTSPRADVILGNSDRIVTLGINWYVNRWVKIQANAIRENIANPTPGPSPSKAVFWSRVLRFQFAL